MVPPRDARRFQLYRREDVSGVSGTGVVADGILWPDGTASLKWRGPDSSVVFWFSVKSMLTIHGHDGKTVVLWLDE